MDSCYSNCLPPLPRLPWTLGHRAPCPTRRHGHAESPSVATSPSRRYLAALRLAMAPFTNGTAEGRNVVSPPVFSPPDGRSPPQFLNDLTGKQLQRCPRGGHLVGDADWAVDAGPPRRWPWRNPMPFGESPAGSSTCTITPAAAGDEKRRKPRRFPRLAATAAPVSEVRRLRALGIEVRRLPSRIPEDT